MPTRTNGLPTAAHMLGNQLNPSSLMAPKLSDSLAAELAEQAGYLEPAGRLVGPPLPGRPAAAAGAGSAAPPGRQVGATSGRCGRSREGLGVWCTEQEQAEMMVR